MGRAESGTEQQGRSEKATHPRRDDRGGKIDSWTSRPDGGSMKGGKRSHVAARSEADSFFLGSAARGSIGADGALTPDDTQGESIVGRQRQWQATLSPSRAYIELPFDDATTDRDTLSQLPAALGVRAPSIAVMAVTVTQPDKGNVHVPK